MAFGSEPFVPFEYSILLESLPTERGAHRYVLAYLQDYTPMGLRDCLHRYEQQLGTPTPSAMIWFLSVPPSRSSSTPEPNHLKCIYYGVAHLWRKHVKCIAYGVSPHADCSTYPAIAHVCGCGKQGHLDAMCPSKLRASKKAANVHCATVSFASAAVTSPDLVHGPHFSKDDGATVEAVGKLYLEKVSASESITYTVKVLNTPVLVRTAGHNDSSEASGAVVYTTHSVTLDDVIFGDHLESITFLILPQSSIPFLFSKALAQRLSMKMDYKDNVMVKGLVSFSIPDVSFTKGAYVRVRLHLDSLYLGVSDCGPTHQLTVLEDFLPYGLAPRFAAHPNSYKTVAFLENVWFPRFGVPEEIRCDQGSKFANACLIELSKRRGFRLSFVPSSYKDGNSLSERWQREVLASVRSLLLKRQLPGSSWPEIHDEPIRHLNNRIQARYGDWSFPRAFTPVGRRNPWCPAE
uniref:Integrase catalytic domain-containing protein n=1 Tax=Chromera velia CCMP2878 TaxID=1169474 RepID=A0A0G4FGI1_9ALVE|eukprot:Cvel_16895.t1-p1 / transcript=Cvel_16895.t1 / gene=Cvel_16895 / organism=Chromera_velia_CCMP2878 / gene_product=hypothetical protein / transcript_product=hypothetical protein / location=Cvel_scaffold1322:39319-42255(+) / protein_length=462 / sequence_SO=supercontig / SO=protein_coding / is_pseudo=false